MLPRHGLTRDEVVGRLREYSRADSDPHSGRMWGHAYETGLGDLMEVARQAYLEFMDKTMLDFTVYPSVVAMENDVVGIAASLVNGEDAVGGFTYGGTESIILAVKSARDYYRRRGITEPEIVLPVTGHPSFRKAAHLLGLRVTTVPIGDDLTVDLERVKEAVTNRTIMIVGSAPNYPFGTIDDIRGLSDIAEDRGVWLHVDACVGGFVLPFMRKLGLDIPDFDFRLPGVHSISMDLHKYGYAPRGASVILYRSRELRLNQWYIDVDWPGYPFVNSTVLSTRSAGPLAAAWAVLHYLGEEGYLGLTRMIINARDRLLRELPRLGFRILGEPKASIVAFTGDGDLFRIADNMNRRGWYIQAQPGSRKLGFPRSIHLTISPIHEKLIHGFIKDLEHAAKDAAGEPRPSVEQILAEVAGRDAGEILGMLGLGTITPGNMALVNELMHMAPPDLVREVLLHAVDAVFTPKRR
jgi:glutamate/tyrosine decarboxylase-like PLP-dependent enzyme